MKPIIIGTRGSKLALWQANWVKSQLELLSPEQPVSLQIIKTQGDKIQDVPLAKVGGKGLFVKEIEEALLRKEIDLAVHSLKDVTVELPDSLTLSIIPKREDPRDAWVSKDRTPFEKLPFESVVGTSSLRRRAQLLALRPDLRIENLRGNLDTRLKKVKAGQFDGALLAAAGLKRMGWESEISTFLGVKDFIPAIGQGVLAIETRQDDDDLIRLLMPLEDRETRIAVTAERAFLLQMEGGCQVPLAGHAIVKGDKVTLEGAVFTVDGQWTIRKSVTDKIENAYQLGVSLADSLLEMGGREIMETLE